MRECEALGRTPKTALRTSLATSLYAYSAMEGGTVLAMFGVCAGSMLEGKGVPWFLGRPEVLHYGRELVSIGPKIVASWLHEFAVMENHVSSENEAAKRLLRRWGATISDQPEMFGGLEFVPFRFERDSRE